MPSWYLEDVTATARQHPDSFYIPTESERAGLRPGDMARLHFTLRSPGPDDPRAERMWVEVEERMGDGASVAYTGWLTNEPGFIRDLAAGDLVEFAPIHVARLLIPASHPDALELGEKAALVSAWALEPGAHACFAYREAADREEDSGWRLFRGDEPDEYLADGSNVRICNVTWLVDRDPTLRELFRAPVGEAFERAGPSAPWVRVDDWAPPAE